jgi:hypothetical protein
MPKILLTPAQRRALLWLPADGSWAKAPRSVSGAVSSLVLYYPQLARAELIGSHHHAYYAHRLTEAGMAERVRQDGLLNSMASCSKHQNGPQGYAKK